MPYPTESAKFLSYVRLLLLKFWYSSQLSRPNSSSSWRAWCRWWLAQRDVYPAPSRMLKMCRVLQSPQSSYSLSGCVVVTFLLPADHTPEGQDYLQSRARTSMSLEIFLVFIIVQIYNQWWATDCHAHSDVLGSWQTHKMTLHYT